MRTFAEKPKTTQPTTSAKASSVSRAHVGQGHDPNSILYLQRPIGNQAVNRLLQTNAAELEGGLTSTTSPRLGHDFSRIPLYPPTARAIQTKLAINKPGDEYEQEADLMAQSVTNTSSVKVQPKLTVNLPGDGYEREADGVAQQLMDMAHLASSDEQQTSEEGQVGISGIPLAETITPIMSRRNVCPLAIPPDLEAAIHREQGTGSAIADNVRKPMQRVFGTDFSSVRIHSGSMSDRLNYRLEARAFTVGNDIFFRKNEYKPDTPQGNTLLAHELTHVVQQDSLETGIPSPIQRWGEETYSQQDLDTAINDFNQNHQDFSVEEIEKIHRALRSVLQTEEGGAVGERNLHIWIAILRFFAGTPLRKFTDQELVNYQIGAARWPRWGDTEEVRYTPAGFIAIRDDFLNRPLIRDDRTLGSMLIHEYLHRYSSSDTGMGSAALPLEGDNYGIELFFAERSGNTDRMETMVRFYNDPHGTIGVREVAGELDRFQEFFIKGYATLVCLYDVIDHGTSRYEDVIPALRGLTSGQAYTLTLQLVQASYNRLLASSSPATRTLNNIIEGVYSNRDRFPITGRPRGYGEESLSDVDVDY